MVKRVRDAEGRVVERMRDVQGRYVRAVCLSAAAPDWTLDVDVQGVLTLRVFTGPLTLS